MHFKGRFQTRPALRVNTAFEVEIPRFVMGSSRSRKFGLFFGRSFLTDDGIQSPNTSRCKRNFPEMP